MTVQFELKMESRELKSKIEEIESKYFSVSDSLIVDCTMESVPLIAANVSKSTRSFSEGQAIYIYDGFWGMAERLKVIGRFRRKNRFILGVCPILNLANHRPKEVYDRTIIRKLAGKRIYLSCIIGCSSHRFSKW